MLTEKVISDTPPRVGRRKVNYEGAPGRFPEGTLARIEAVLQPGEKQADFLRDAVEAELTRREREAKRKT